jgi:hypothetical protein
MKDIDRLFQSKLTESPQMPWNRGDNGPLGTWRSGDETVDDPAHNPSQIENNNMLNRLNAFLSAISNRQFVNPYTPLAEVATKLEFVGLSFAMQKVAFAGDRGSITMPLTQWGGRYGMDMDGQVKSDDGISYKIPGGLGIRFTWVVIKGFYTMDIQIVPGVAPDSIHDILDD